VVGAGRKHVSAAWIEYSAHDTRRVAAKSVRKDLAPERPAARGQTAQMTYYETPNGAKVFAAGAFYFTRWSHVDPITARLVDNVWTRLSRS
jgi:hypothetical protein